MAAEPWAKRGLHEVDRGALVGSVRSVCMAQPVRADATGDTRVAGIGARLYRRVRGPATFRSGTEEQFLRLGWVIRPATRPNLAGRGMARLPPFLPNTLI